MPAGREGLQEVELDEDDARPETDTPPRVGRLAAGARRLRGLVRPALAVLVVGALVAGVVQWRQESARAARLAITEGVAGSLSLPLVPAWQVAADLVGSTAGGTVLVVGDGTLRALDEQTGEPRWSVTVPAVCSAGSDALVLCTDPGRQGLETGGVLGTPARAGVGTQQVAVVDGTTGTVVRTTEPAWSSWSSALVGDELVLVGIDDGGRTRASATDARSGAAVWAYAAPAPAAGVRTVTLTLVDAGSLVLTAGATVTVLDLTTGQERPPEEGSVPTTRPAVPSVDDGSVPGLSIVDDLTTTDEVVLVEPGTATEHRVVARRLGPLVDGRLVTITPVGDLVAVDARIGAELWRHSDGSTLDPLRTPVTDGTRLLTIEGARLRLVALSMTTGEVLWSEPWEPTDGTELAVTPSGAVIAFDGTRVTGLGRP